MSSLKLEIVIDPQAKRDLKKLKRTHNSLLPRIIHEIDSLSSSPYEGKLLSGSKAGCYSLRVGDYRIIYEVHPHKSALHIIRVGHRREIYR